MEASARFRLNGSRIIHEDFDNEIVIVNLDSGRYYCVQHAGAEIWRMVVAGSCVGDLTTTLSAGYAAADGVIAEGVDALLSEMREQELIVELDGEPPAPGASVSRTDRPRQPFVAPRLQTYTDMQDLLLLDPIHEVDATGWPAARPDNGQTPQ